MRIIVDADSCSKIRQIEEIAEEKGLPVMLFCDTAHQLYSDYSKMQNRRYRYNTGLRTCFVGPG